MTKPAAQFVQELQALVVAMTNHLNEQPGGESIQASDTVNSQWYEQLQQASKDAAPVHPTSSTRVRAEDRDATKPRTSQPHEDTSTQQQTQNRARIVAFQKRAKAILGLCKDLTAKHHSAQRLAAVIAQVHTAAMKRVKQASSALEGAAEQLATEGISPEELTRINNVKTHLARGTV